MTLPDITISNKMNPEKKEILERIQTKRASSINHTFDSKRNSQVSHRFDRNNRLKRENVSEIAVSIVTYNPNLGPVSGRFYDDPFRSISLPRNWEEDDHN